MATTEKKDTNSHPISQEVRDRAKDYRKDATLILDDDKKHAQITLGDSAYMHKMPDSITEKVLKDLDRHNRTTIAAGGLMAGEMAEEAFKKYKGLERVEATMKTTGRDRIEYVIDREKVSRDPSSGKEITTNGAMRVVWKQTAAKGSVGDLSAVRKEIAERCKKSFG